MTIAVPGDDASTGPAAGRGDRPVRRPERGAPAVGVLSDGDGDEGDELAWLAVLLGVAAGSDQVEHLARPSADEPRFLVPIAPPAAAAAALRRFDDNRSPAQAAAGTVGRGLARLGLLGFAPGERVALPRFAIVDRIATALGESELLAAVTIGERRRNRKPVLQLVTPAGRIVGFAKVGWSPLTTELVANEGDVLEQIEDRLPSTVRAPIVLHRQPWGDGEVVVTSPLLPDRRIGWHRRQDRPEAPTPDEIVTAISHAAGPRRLDAAATGSVVGRAATALEAVLDLDEVLRPHRGIELAIGLWHGDLTPWNLLAGPATTAVWDWEFAGTDRPVGFDALHHEFERRRRAPGGGHRAALTATVVDAADTLRPFLRAGADERVVDAIVDLYLCELIGRELRLDGQRWPGGAMAGLAPEAIALLELRSRRTIPQ